MRGPWGLPPAALRTFLLRNARREGIPGPEGGRLGVSPLLRESLGVADRFLALRPMELDIDVDEPLSFRLAPLRVFGQMCNPSEDRRSVRQADLPPASQQFALLDPPVIRRLRPVI